MPMAVGIDGDGGGTMKTTNTVTTNDIVRAMARRLGWTHLRARLTYDWMMRTFREILARGERIMISEFGAFEVVERKPRSGRDPRTGERIRIPARREVVFRPAPALRALVRQGDDHAK